MEITYRLLIVDDQSRTRQSMKALLETNFPQIEIFEASDGIEALQSFEMYRPDMIVMDARMPELDGIDATRLIKGNSPRTKIIVLSMYADYQAAAIAAGADTFLRKEESPEPLLAAIAASIQSFSNCSA